jgi:hypothetical protein
LCGAGHQGQHDQCGNRGGNGETPECSTHQFRGWNFS